MSERMEAAERLHNSEADRRRSEMGATLNSALNFGTARSRSLGSPSQRRDLRESSLEQFLAGGNGHTRI